MIACDRLNREISVGDILIKSWDKVETTVKVIAIHPTRQNVVWAIGDNDITGTIYATEEWTRLTEE